MLRIPTAVLMMIGQIAVMKMTKIAEGWPLRKAASESGSHASGGTVRRTWKNGSMISSQVSLRTREGGGSVEPARRQSSSQISNATAMTTTGGTTRSATLPSTILVRVASAGRFGGSGRTFAVVAGVTVAGSAFMSGMFMIWCPGQS